MKKLLIMAVFLTTSVYADSDKVCYYFYGDRVCIDKNTIGTKLITGVTLYKDLASQSIQSAMTRAQNSAEDKCINGDVQRVNEWTIQLVSLNDKVFRIFSVFECKNLN